MTHHLGTFIPHQGHNIGWGIVGLNPWHPGATWGHSGHWNTNGAWNQTPGQNSIWLTPAYGSNHQEIAQNAPIQTPQFAFVPHQGGIAGGAYLPGTTTGAIYTPWQSGHNAPASIGHSLATELAENNHEYVISFDVPGINIEDLDVSLSGSTIVINGIRKGSNESLAYSEIARGNLSRTIAVPFEVTPNKSINTSLENGVLKIRIAKDGHAEKKLVHVK